MALTGLAAGAALGGAAPALAAALAALAAAAWGVCAFLPRGSRATRRQAAHARAVELLSEHANDTVLLVDGEGRIVRANSRIRDSHGWSPEEVIGRDVADLRAPGAAGQLADDLERIRREGSLRYETLHRRRDGGTFQADVSARAFEAGGEWFVQAIVRDVTGRRATLRTLSFQAELLQNLHDAVIGLDRDHVVRTWNAAATRMYRVAAADAVGRRIGELLPSDYAGMTAEEFRDRLDRAGRLTYEVRRTLPDGARVDVEASAVVLRGDDGAVTGYVTVNRDVTARKRAEEALRHSQERLSRILETSSEGIVIVDARGATEFMNARAADLFGVRIEDAVGRPLLEAVPALQEGRAPGDVAAMLRGVPGRRELELARPDGGRVWLDASWTALREEGGRIAGGVGLLMDVSARRRARDQLLHAQKMEAVGRLASGIAHDFNNLLVSILSCAGFLLESLPEGDERRQDAAEIKVSGERAAQLVRQLLAFGRKSPPSPDVISLDGAVRRVESILRRTIEPAVSIHVDSSARLQTRIDPGHLEQVIMNLAVNARDAMPAGGTLTIETRDVEVQVPPEDAACLAPGRYARLRVVDTGTGIAPELLPVIFEPFFTTKEEGRGTGLGLSTAYGIVEDAGGKIAVWSRPGEGSSFTVWFPASEPGALAEPAAVVAPRVDARWRGAKVLVVDDDDGIRRLVTRVLEASGLAVVEAASGAEALRRLEGDAGVSLVLADVVMPGMAGTDLAVAVDGRWPAIPVVLMSGYFEAQRRPTPRPLILKPFTPGALVGGVEAALAAAGGAGGNRVDGRRSA